MSDEVSADEVQLLGAVLSMATVQDARAIFDQVPPTCFTDPLDRAVYSAAAGMANTGVWDRATLARLVVEAGLWPVQLHGEVTGRIVDRINTCLWPTAWPVHAAAVVDGHVRRTVAEKLVGLADVLREGSLTDVARALFDAADFAQMGRDHVLAVTSLRVSAHG